MGVRQYKTIERPDSVRAEYHSDPRKTKRPQHNRDHDRPHTVHSRDVHEMGNKTDRNRKDKDEHPEGAGEEKPETNDKNDHGPVQQVTVNPVKKVREAGQSYCDEVGSTGRQDPDHHKLAHCGQRKFRQGNHDPVAHSREGKERSKADERIGSIRRTGGKNIGTAIFFIADDRCQHTVCRGSRESREPPHGNTGKRPDHRTLHNGPVPHPQSPENAVPAGFPGKQ